MNKKPVTWRVCGRRIAPFFMVVTFIACSALVHAYQLPDTGQTKCYDNTREIPCPQPGEPFYGQDAQYQGVQPTYRDDGDGTVTDLNTGLIWQQGDAQDDQYRTWQQAMDYCAALDLGGHSDWRLPAVEESTSLTSIGRFNPAIETQYFPQCRSYGYWSSSTGVHYPDYAWGVGFYSGYVSASSKTYDDNYVRCVRDGP